MRVGVLHLSDIHFRRGKNPVQLRVTEIASAINSVAQGCGLFLTLVTGDIAFSGSAEEYAEASVFFAALDERIKAEGRCLRTWMVPGNHDCTLPESENSLRAALIQGLLPSLPTLKPDEALLSQVLSVQSHYYAFRNGDAPQPPPRTQLFGTTLIQEAGVTVQLNHYNTALLSRREEKQGELSLPMQLITSGVAVSPEAILSLSLFHHSYLWLESNVAVAFRGHIERTSDVVFSGHQHFQHSFDKSNSTGERILYLEGSALQDEYNPQSSAFNILLFDIADSQQQLMTFRWSGALYKVTHDSGWQPLVRNVAARMAFRLNAGSISYLSEPGSLFRHSRAGAVTFADIFVMPNIQVGRLAIDASTKEIRSEAVVQYVRDNKRVIFQAPPLAGKTSLLKQLYKQLFESGDYIPVRLDGESIQGVPSEKKTPTSFWRAFVDQYEQSTLADFQQLSGAKRALLIDDWHKTKLNPEGRRIYLEIAKQYFDTIILFADDMFSLQELVEKSTSSLFSFSHASIPEFRAELRGRLIEKWISLGQEYTASSRDLAREVEDTERLIRSVMGKNTLPSRPFIILTLLQAAQEGKTQSTEAGSFGYLYEVLVTTALSASQTATPQLEKKYVFLAMVAYEMFKTDAGSLSDYRVRQIASEYERSHLVKIDVDSMLADLVHVRALVKSDGNYSFAYTHLLYFFVARYYKDNLPRDDKRALTAEIEHMVDNIGSDRYSTILLFIVYFARNISSVVKRLVENANRIYSGVPPADLVGGVGSIEDIAELSEVELPEEDADLADQRTKRRRRLDAVENSRPALTRTSYSDDLTDPEKFRIGTKHIELLGQVLRNFPGSLPGPEKLEILCACYLLDLRLLAKLFDWLAAIDRSAREAADKKPSLDEEDADAAQAREAVARISKSIGMLGRFAAVGMISKVSNSVGLSDLEAAYDATVEAIGITDATRLINVAIRLEHFGGFPESMVRALHREFKNRNAFADRLLLDLVLGHMIVYGVDRGVRHRMMSEFNLKPNVAAMLESGTSRR
ncbi:MAG TPA: metallophosphoesterase [Terriglobales bacterium]